MSAAYVAYSEAMAKAGVVLGGNRLRPTSEATTVRVKDGKTEVLDGPYADTKEQLGGYYLLDVPDLDAALSWAARCPGAANGTIEVRAIWPMTAPRSERERRARGRRDGRARKLRQAGGVPLGAHARRRGCRGRAVRRLRGRARGLAGERRPAQVRKPGC